METKLVSFELEKLFNDSCIRPTELAYRFATTAHRAIQRDVARFAIEYLFMLGEMYHSGQYDGRNEDMAKLGSEILQCANAVYGIDPDLEYPVLHAALNWHQQNADKQLNGNFY